MTKRLTREFVSQELNRLGFRLESDYTDAKSHIIVLCHRGHRWTTTFDSARNSPCAYCTDKAHKTSVDYFEIAERLGYKWIGELPSRTTDKTRWLCDAGHEFNGRFLDLKQGHRCPFCAKHSVKTNYHYNKLAIECSIEWLGPLPKNTNAHTNWICRVGHQFSTSYKSVSHRGNCGGCSICSKSRTGDTSPKWMGGRPASKFRRRSATPTDNLKFATADVVFAMNYWDEKCAYCGAKEKLHLDHFIPVSRGGTHERTNIVPACRHCNVTKNAKMPDKWLPEKFGLEYQTIYHRIEMFFLATEEHYKSLT